MKMSVAGEEMFTRLRDMRLRHGSSTCMARRDGMVDDGASGIRAGQCLDGGAGLV